MSSEWFDAMQENGLKRWESLLDKEGRNVIINIIKVESVNREQKDIYIQKLTMPDNRHIGAFWE